MDKLVQAMGAMIEAGLPVTRFRPGRNNTGRFYFSRKLTAAEQAKEQEIYKRYLGDVAYVAESTYHPVSLEQ